MGGDQVLFWYIVGPFTDHFAVGKAQWRSTTAIKRRTFRGIDVEPSTVVMKA